jgi:hypothetical protein
MTLIEQVAMFLQNEGVATLTTDMFLNYLPDNPDNVVAIIDTGGTEPDTYLPTRSPTFQILVRNSNYDNGKAKLDEIRDLLHQKKGNLGAGDTYFYYIFATAEGGSIGHDVQNREEFSINFRARTR